MAKRISAFTKEYSNLENAKVIEILEKNGIPNKKPQSGLSEEEEALVVKELSSLGYKKTNGEPKASTEAPKQPVSEKKVSEEPAKTVVGETEQKTTKKNTAALEKTEAKVEEQKAEENKEKETASIKKDMTEGNKNLEKSAMKPPVKKKKIITLDPKPAQSGNRYGQRGQQGDNRSSSYSNGIYNNGNRNQGNRGPVRPSGPIKPRENMIDRAAEVTKRQMMKEREEALRQQAAERAKEEELRREQQAERPTAGAVERTENRGYNSSNMERSRDNYGERNGQYARNDRNGQQNRSFDRGGQGGARQGERSFGGRDGQRPAGNDRNGNRGFNKPFDGKRDGQGGDRFGNKKEGGFQRPAQDARGGFQRPGAKPANKGGFTAEAIIPENDKHQERRNASQDRDKRSKKDQLYEEDNEILLGKGRNSKAGRFIKPVKVKEEVKEDDIKVITLPEEITIKELADKMKIQPSAIVKKLFLQGKMITVNQVISFAEAEEIALEYEIMCEQEEKVDVIAELLKEEDEAAEVLEERPPVVCVMGHVDHGKTSLLDAIRKTNVTDREAGGITQHIGAYTVNVKGRQITFLDTPGHEAFTAMRMRGANSTDIAILVVAADDGVMPQTKEAISHAKAAGIEILVAVNKIDKPGANIDRVKQELTEYELIAEDWGGQTIFAPVSAKTGEGIEDLLEMILLSADVLELKANPKRKARGLVIEAELDKGRGPVATILVQKGTLRVGDFISAGASHGKVRAMVDDKGRRVKEALPSQPVEILGLNDVPNAGEIFICHENDKEAKFYAETFIEQNKAKLLEETKGKMSLDELYSKIQEGNLKELNLIIKADVQGSVEAVKQSMLKLSNDEVVVKIIHGGVGAINESDVILASASSAIIIGFNVRPDMMAKQTAEREGVDVRLYRVIYQAIEEIQAAMKGMLDPIYEEKVIGHAEVRQIFKASTIGNIAGSFVLDGYFQRDCKIRISREGEQIYEGALASLKRFKDDVKEVKAGYDCGFVFEGFDQMKELDIVEAYIMVEVLR